MFLRQTYDSFGNSTKIRSPLTVDIDDLNRYTYNGEDYDYNTGLQYLRSRYYSTSTGNFISQDTYLGDVITPLSQNRYTYCHNNPVMNDDPSGHLIFPFLAVVAGAYQLYNTYQYAKSEIAEVQDYHKQVDTYTQEMADLAESGKMVELCQYTDLSFLGTEYLPDNVVFNNSANRYVIFDTKAQADSYHEFETKRSEAARKLWSFYGHLSLDVLGLIPGYGAIFDLTNAVWYAAEGDYVNASMSAIAAGLEIASMFKPEAKVAESTLEKYGDEAFDMNKASAKKATDVVDTIPDVCNKNRCFIAGTKVLTVDGLKAIEDIEVGDVVVATDPETGETTEKEVKNTFVNETDELAHVFVDGEEIVCTPGHKFYAPEKGWTSAIKLRAGDQLQLVNGEYVTVEKVQHELLEEPVKVYNFEVEDFHTYYVGTDVQVLVHNMRCSAIENDKSFGNYEFKEGIDIDLRGGKGTFQDALDLAFQKAGLSKENFTVTKWGKNKYGKSFPVEWKASNGAEVSVDLGHSLESGAPTVPHVGWQTGGKRGNGGAVRGHIFVDDVPYNR